ncbi:hypothetical protein O3P69_012285 [Scylla paramamosain]|uniref:Uncharacterized protein n=1 Tax=Scylla paramamosain TaxID=85552 RepID=A0AAW0TD85_SCYPA
MVQVQSWVQHKMYQSAVPDRSTAWTSAAAGTAAITVKPSLPDVTVTMDPFCPTGDTTFVCEASVKHFI